MTALCSLRYRNTHGTVHIALICRLHGDTQQWTTWLGRVNKRGRLARKGSLHFLMRGLHIVFGPQKEH